MAPPRRRWGIHVVAGIFDALHCPEDFAGCDPVSEKPPVSTQGPPIAHDGPKIVPNHIGSPEWDKAHQPDARIKTIPVQPNPGVTLKPIPTKPRSKL